MVDKVAKKHGTEAVAKGYLDYLYSDEGQRIIARYHYRPSNPAILKETAAQFLQLALFTVKDLEGIGTRHRRSTSPRAGCSTRFTNRAANVTGPCDNR